MLAGASTELERDAAVRSAYLGGGLDVQLGENGESTEEVADR